MGGEGCVRGGGEGCGGGEWCVRGGGEGCVRGGGEGCVRGGVPSPMPHCQHGSQELLSSDSLLPKGKLPKRHKITIILAACIRRSQGTRLDFNVRRSRVTD